MRSQGFRSLVELLRFRAQVQKDSPAYTFLTDGETEGAAVTYGELDRQSRAIATRLQRETGPGARALLVYPPGLEFIAAFFGCLYAGVAAVPVHPPHPVRPGRSLPRLLAIARDAAVQAVLSVEAVMPMAPALAGEVQELAAARWVATDRLVQEPGDTWQEPPLDPDTLAFLQYTSGSTAAPRGVMVRHRNLLHNLAYIQDRAENDADTVSVSWLPVYHDMGLIEGVLEPVFVGYPAYLMAPTSFLQRPLRWLQAISRLRATNSGGPNFAYDLCVRKTTPEQREGLDLASWRVAYNGAEPVRKETLERFRRAFEPHGFHWSAFYPVYGLAEATLAVTSGGRLDEPVCADLDATALGAHRVVDAAPGTPSVTLVGCGGPSFGMDLAVAHPDTRTRCAAGEVGEIWLSSPSVTAGYWNRPEETERTFRAYVADTGEGPFLRTGDLGFLRDGELFVTGRLKDLLIIRGRNHYPQDLELTVERSHPAIRPGCCAAFSVEVDGAERVVVVAEVEDRGPARGRRPGGRPGPPSRPALGPIFAAVRQAVAEQHELQVHAVTLLAPGGIPKTSSSKLQRQACRAGFLAGTLEAVGQWSPAGRGGAGGHAEPSP